jgi:hypothetical protein
LLPDKSARKYSPPIDSEVGRIIMPVLLFVVGLVVLPLAWKFVLLVTLIIIGGYLLNMAAEQKPREETGIIDLGEKSITWTHLGEASVTLELRDVIELKIWSNFYPGYILPEQNARRSDGRMQLSFTLKDGTKFIKECLVSDSLHYKTVVNVLKDWYRLGIPIKESVGFDKYRGFLMGRQSDYTFAELQAAKAELGIR